MSQSLKLALADGRQWVIRPVDAEAAVIVAELGNVMRLGPACGTGTPGKEGRELCVAVAEEPDASVPSDTEPDGAVVCRPAAPNDCDARVVQMMRIADKIAREALVRGGLLLHSALAEYQGSGFMMAGPGSVGKSTASRRLPLPWRSLCDDATLVVRDDNGQYWAHPWPTWSRFWSGGPGGSWDVEQPVPVRAVFFLGQAPADKLEPVNATQAAALTLESAVNLVRAAFSPIPSPQSLVSDGVRAAKAMALAVPAYSLELSLDGRFWEEIERVLPETGDQGQETGDRLPSPEPPNPGTPEAIDPHCTFPAQVPPEGSTLALRSGRRCRPTAQPSRFANGSLRVVGTGTSMSPTLDVPDLLEVRPYGPGRMRRGDVVCFKSPDTGRTVVHRVVAVGTRSPVSGRLTGGIRTRGDNTSNDDPWVLQAGDIIGRVTAAHRGARRRVVAGGWQGIVGFRCLRLVRRIRMRTGHVPHTLYGLVAGLGPFDYLLPRSLRTRLVRFDARRRVFLKLLVGRQMVGQYDERSDRWRIRRPFRLFVKEQTIRKAVASSEEAPG